MTKLLKSLLTSLLSTYTDKIAKITAYITIVLLAHTNKFTVYYLLFTIQIMLNFAFKRLLFFNCNRNLIFNLIGKTSFYLYFLLALSVCFDNFFFFFYGEIFWQYCNLFCLCLSIDLFTLFFILLLYYLLDLTLLFTLLIYNIFTLVFFINIHTRVSIQVSVSGSCRVKVGIFD